MSATDEVAVKLSCPICIAGKQQVGIRNGRVVHRLLAPAQDAVYWAGNPAQDDLYRPCPDWDSEFRHVSEPVGFHTFAWRPVRCRNGRWRWLTWVERFPDGTFAIGNRAH